MNKYESLLKICNHLKGMYDNISVSISSTNNF